MTDQSRLAAAHAKLRGHDAQCSSVFGRCASWDAIHAILAADPTLICPDPADHELAAAVRRVFKHPGIVTISGEWDDPVRDAHYYRVQLGVAYDRSREADVTASTLEAAIAAALEDKP